MGWRLTPLYAGLRFQEYCHEGCWSTQVAVCHNGAFPDLPASAVRRITETKTERKRCCRHCGGRNTSSSM